MTDSFLTKVSILDLVRISNKKKLLTGKDRHRAVNSLFPSYMTMEEIKSAKILFRFDQNPKESFFLIRSKIAPAALNGVNTIRENIDDLMGEKTLVSFRVSVNPTKRTTIKNKDSGKSKIKENVIIDYDEQVEWLKDKLSLSFNNIEIINSNTSVIKRAAHPSDKSLLTIVEFNGFGEISNIDELNKLLEKGVGRSKSYGAGLLTVKKIR